MKGVIVINPYLVPENSLRQADRLKKEFNALNVDIKIVSNGFLRSCLTNNNLQADFDCDFIIYLDKDKYLSNILERLGFKLFNTHRAIRICDDKAQTYIALAGKGVNLPKTIFGALCFRNEKDIDDSWANEIINKLGLPVIVKECYGSLGAGVFKAENKTELVELMKKVKLKPHLFQEYVGASSGKDVRVIVIGGKAKCAMLRSNQNDFRSNVELGGKGEAIELSTKFRETAEMCAKVLGLDYCGVDLMISKKGQPIVCEVNSNAFFEGIEKATGFNVAKEYAMHVINSLKK